MTRLKAIRQDRRVAAARLAAQAGVSRQSIYAMEDGEFIPNTVVALKLARALGVTVEELFPLPEEATTADDGELLSHDLPAEPDNQLVRVVRARSQELAIPLRSDFNFLPVGDDQADVRVPSLLLAGCDPALSIWADMANRAGIHLALVAASSLRALEWLKEGKVDLAGSHFPDAGRRKASALPGSVAGKVFTFAESSVGLAMRAEQKGRIRSLSDLASRSVSIANREQGSGSRARLDRALRQAGIKSSEVEGYEREVHGHLAAARAVADGWADCCFVTASAARCYGLHFVEIDVERFDIAFAGRVLETREGKTLVNLLQSAAFRRRLDRLGVYDTTRTGAELPVKAT